jgi:hypothetical protein
MRKVVMWDDDDANTHNRLRLRDYVMTPDDVIGLDDVISR